MKQTLVGFGLAFMSVGMLACTSSTNSNGSAPANGTAAPSPAIKSEPSPARNSTATENESPKIGTLTGETILTEEIGEVFLVVRLDDGRQKVIPIKDPNTGQPITDPFTAKNVKVEVRPAKDAKHGEWELVRIVKARK